MKIAIVVPGRFDAFDLAKALIDKNEEVVIYTNYPRWAAKRFGIPAGAVRSFCFHGIISRIAWRLKEKLGLPYPESWLNTIFGRWAAKHIIGSSWDIVHTWSGFSEEVLKAIENSSAVRILMRGSSHIRTQSRLLEEEERRCRTSIEKPSRWIIAREEREYEMADHIRVLSNFAYGSFIEEGINPRKLVLVPSAVSTKDFRPSQQVIEERQRRILSGEPLSVLYIGALSFQKGLLDSAVIINGLKGKNIRFCLVGPASEETKEFLNGFRRSAEIISKQPQYKLPEWYNNADLFIFPTIQDGYAVVLAQAQASGLPIIATTNCAGPDIIIEGKTGWVVPIRKPDAFIERILWCDSHRSELAEMVKEVYGKHKPKDWKNIAEDFIDICSNLKKGRR